MTKSWQHRYHSRRHAALAEGPHMLTTEVQNLDEALDILARQQACSKRKRRRRTLAGLLSITKAGQALAEKRRAAPPKLKPAAPFAWTTEDEARALARSMYSERGIKPVEISRRLGIWRGVTKAKVLAWLNDLLPEWQKAPRERPKEQTK